MSAFGGTRSLVWTNVRGEVAINKRARGPHGGITMSIDIKPLSAGGCRVDMWTSNNWHYVWLPMVINQAHGRSKIIM